MEGSQSIKQQFANSLPALASPLACHGGEEPSVASMREVFVSFRAVRKIRL
jgi:hypothetical protein